MKKIFVTKPMMPSYTEYCKEIESIWNTRQLSNFGEKYNKLIRLLQEKYKYNNIDLQVNGHLMLESILKSIDKGEVITTPFTFVSTTLAIKNAGHKVVFCDINENDYNIDVDKIEKLINNRTVAIVPVHVFGNPCDVNKLDEIAKEYNLKIIYDAAHAFACKYDDIDIGNYGYASMFSFHATKVFNTIEGGLGVFKSASFCEKVKGISNFGLNVAGVSEKQGTNSKYNEFQAAMGIVNLKNIETSIERRELITKKYDEAFRNIAGLKIIYRDEKVKYNYAYYPLVIQDDFRVNVIELIDTLNDNEIYPRRYFYPAINSMKQFADGSSTPIANKISENIICLPLYDSLEMDDVERIIRVIKGE